MPQIKKEIGETDDVDSKYSSNGFEIVTVKEESDPHVQFFKTGKIESQYSFRENKDQSQDPDEWIHPEDNLTMEKFSECEVIECCCSPAKAITSRIESQYESMNSRNHNSVTNSDELSQLDGRLKQNKSASTSKPGSYGCETCGRYFAYRRTLSKHFRIHTDSHPYECEICSKSFTQSSSLKTHSFIHTGLRPFTCEVCRKSFYTKSNLTAHIRIHTGHRPYICEICKKSFTNFSNLGVHKLIHTGHRPFSCEVCWKSFSTKSCLKRHMCTHKSSHAFL